MKLSVVYPVVVVPSLLLLVSTAGSERQDVGESRGSLLEQLRSPSGQERCSAWTQLKAERRGTIYSVLRFARAETDEFPLEYEKPDAIELLGEYRAVEARGFLLDRVAYSPRFSLLYRDDPLNWYPAARALVEIGEPAIREILSSGVRRSVSDEELKIFAYLIWVYYTPLHEQDIGLYRMQRLLERAEAEREAYNKKLGQSRGPTAGEGNLRRLIDTYQKIRPNDPKDWPRPDKLPVPAGDPAASDTP
jgi:hypothetical protein